MNFLFPGVFRGFEHLTNFCCFFTFSLDFGSKFLPVLLITILRKLTILKVFDELPLKLEGGC